MNSEIPTLESWIVPQNKGQEMQEKNENFSCKNVPDMVSSISLKTGGPLRRFFTGVRGYDVRKNAYNNRRKFIMDLMKVFTEQYKKAEAPAVEVGDTVRVHIKVKEGNRERIQVFEGTVIAKKHGGIEETFTVRRVSYGVGVEKVLPIHSPVIERIETVRKGKVRRAKLYYLRDRVGKGAKVKERL